MADSLKPRSSLIIYMVFASLTVTRALEECVIKVIGSHNTGSHILLLTTHSEHTTIIAPHGAFVNTRAMVDTKDVLIKNLHGLRNVSLTVFTSSEQMNQYEGLETKANMVILPLGVKLPAKDLGDQLSALHQHPSWSPRMPHLVTTPCPGDVNATNLARDLLQELWNRKIANAVVGIPADNSQLALFSWFPFRSHHHCGEIVHDVILVESCLPGGQFLNNAPLFPSKGPTNLHGCPITASVNAWLPYVITNNTANDNNDVFVDYEDGLEIRLIKIIARSLNFTLRFRPPRSTQWAGAAEDVKSGRSDVVFGCFGAVPHHWQLMDATKSYQKEYAKWFVPNDNPIPRWESLGRVFKIYLWLFVIGSYIVVSCVLYLAEGIRTSQDSLIDNFMICLVVLLTESANYHPKYTILRFIFTLWLFSCVNINYAYQSALVSILANPGYFPPISTVEELVESGLVIGMPPGFVQTAVAMDDVSINKILTMYVNCSDMNKCLDRVAFHKDMAMESSSSYVDYHVAAKYTFNGKSLIKDIDIPLFIGDVVMYLQKGNLLKHPFDAIITRIIESGLVVHWWDDIFQSAKYVKKLEESVEFQMHGEPAGHPVLSMSHLQGAFYIFIAGSVLSITVFVKELLSQREICYEK